MSGSIDIFLMSIRYVQELFEHLKKRSPVFTMFFVDLDAFPPAIVYFLILPSEAVPDSSHSRRYERYLFPIGYPLVVDEK